MYKTTASSQTVTVRLHDLPSRRESLLERLTGQPAHDQANPLNISGRPPGVAMYGPSSKDVHMKEFIHHRGKLFPSPFASLCLSHFEPPCSRVIVKNHQ